MTLFQFYVPQICGLNDATSTVLVSSGQVLAVFSTYEHITHVGFLFVKSCTFSFSSYFCTMNSWTRVKLTIIVKKI